MAKIKGNVNQKFRKIINSQADANFLKESAIVAF